MQLKRVSLSKINPAPYNPRKDLKPDDPQYQQLVRSMDEFGCVQPLVWNRRSGNLVGGHQRFKVLLAQGVKEVQVSVVDLPPAKEKALNLALNKISGDWNHGKLTELLGELTSLPEIDVAITGFEMPEVEQLLAGAMENNDSGRDHYDVEADLARNLPTITQPGELVELGLHGEHRLLCGDVTKPADMARLLGDSRARMCNTDPPYGVRYDSANRPSAKAAKPSKMIRNDDLTPKRYRTWFTKVAAALKEALVAGSPFYVWNAHKNFGLMHDLLSCNDFKVASVITWAKESFSPGFGDYNEQVEYCLYGWKVGARHRWYGPKNESTLWQVHRDRTKLYRHPTQKALELAGRALRNSSRRDEIVFDPFLGSGTTLIAAAGLGRRCFGMEIEPRYCDVIVRRYIALAGGKAVKPELAKRYAADDPAEVKA